MRLAAIYGFVAVAAVAFAFSVGALMDATEAEAQQVLPNESLLDTACTTARQIGIIGGANIEKCRLVSVMDEGQTALITVKVKVSGQGWFAVALAYQRSVWTQSAIQITPVG
jgi:hypothetical protein